MSEPESTCSLAAHNQRLGIYHTLQKYGTLESIIILCFFSLPKMQC